MSESKKRPPSQPMEIEGTDRWVAGKTEVELLSDLKVYLARLRDDPRSIVDRLRVAAIQLRLGRVQEALIHYEGVLRGYVASGQLMSAIALCQRILDIYPNIPRIQNILTALCAHAPHLVAGSAAAPVTDDPARPSAFVAGGMEESGSPSEKDRLLHRVFHEARLSSPENKGQEHFDRRGDSPSPLPGPEPSSAGRQESDSRPRPSRSGDEKGPILLTTPKSKGGTPPPVLEERSDVVLLTKRKKRR
jgi:hypothetical protein